MLSLILAALLTSPGVGSPTAKLSPGNLGEELYYASAAASGSRLCDRKRAARLGKKFDQCFGDRIRALRETHEALGSGLTDQSQKMTVAARAMAEKTSK